MGDLPRPPALLRTVNTALTEVSRLVDIPLTQNEEIAGAPHR